MGEERKVCFVITPIGEEGSATRLRSDQVFTHIIEPVVRDLGYEPLRANDIPHPGMITHQIIQHLLNADLVVADLTDGNPNVFYELGIRHMTRKPVVSIVEVGNKIPFDVNQSRTILLNHHDLDSAANCRQQLELQVSSLEQNPNDYFNPVSVTVDLEALRQSSDPDAQGLAQVFTLLEAMNIDLNKLRYEVTTIRATPDRRIDVSVSPDDDRRLISSPRPLADEEVELLRLRAQGKSSQEIAQELGWEVPQVRGRLHRVFRALGARNLDQALLRFERDYPHINLSKK